MRINPAFTPQARALSTDKQQNSKERRGEARAVLGSLLGDLGLVVGQELDRLVNRHKTLRLNVRDLQACKAKMENINRSDFM